MKRKVVRLIIIMPLLLPILVAFTSRPLFDSSPEVVELRFVFTTGCDPKDGYIANLMAAVLPNMHVVQK